MKKNIFILGLMALAATVTSCSKNDDDNNNIVDPDVTTMPEGTSDPRVTIVETDADYNDPRYQANWGNYAEAVSSHLKNDAETLYKAWNEGLNGGEAFQTTFKEAKGAYHSYNDCIEQILDKYGDIKDSASDALFDIRKTLRSKEGAVSKKAAAILAQAQAAGLADADAGVTVREGKYLIPVASSAKRKLSGFVYGESATGKTSYIEPAELIELENELAELRFAETREIERILLEFTDFVRPYLPDLLASAAFIGEIDFLMNQSFCVS